MNRKKRLLYRCSYRGTKELDLILRNFINNCTVESELSLLEEMLEESEQSITDWLVLNESPPSKYHNLVELIKNSIVA